MLHGKQRFNRTYLNDFVCGRIIGKLDEMASKHEELGVTDSTIARAWKTFNRTRTAFRTICSGHQRKVTSKGGINV